MFRQASAYQYDSAHQPKAKTEMTEFELKQLFPKHVWKPGTLLMPVPVVLVSCGGGKSPSAPREAPAPGESAPQTPAEPEPTPEAPAFDEEKFNAALALKGEDISLLFEAIGEPLESSYAPSCIGASGEDGELIYEGFYVATYRNGEKEIVWDVISDVG